MSQKKLVEDCGRLDMPIIALRENLKATKKIGININALTLIISFLLFIRKIDL